MNKGHEHFIEALRKRGVSEELINSLSEEDCDSLIPAMSNYELIVMNESMNLLVRDMRTTKKCAMFFTILAIISLSLVVCSGLFGLIFMIIMAAVR